MTTLLPHARKRRWPVGRRFVLACGLLFFAAGCTKSAPPRFHANRQDMVKTVADQDSKFDPHAFTVTSADKDEDARQLKEGRAEAVPFIATALTAAFGTPDEPYLLAELHYHPQDNAGGLDIKKLRRAAGRAKQGHAGLYREHCSHCHGISGDGAGPTAAFLNPYPRDYRQGIFKFKSTESAALPTREDLMKVLKQGIHGTAMPSFLLLPEQDLEALLEYVKYLSIRGAVESALALELLPEGKPLVDPVEYNHDEARIAAAQRQRIVEIAKTEVDRWNEAAGLVISPPAPEVPADETPEQQSQRLAAARAAGRELFMAPTKGNCVSCHGPTGLGDGNPKKLFDDWNKPKVALPDAAEFWQLPIQELQPRNLRLGIYRGGRRPIDIYRRIHGGIRGTEMPPNASKSEGAKPENSGTSQVTGLQPQEIWNLVEYVLSIPYEGLPAPAETAQASHGVANAAAAEHSNAEHSNAEHSNAEHGEAEQKESP